MRDAGRGVSLRCSRVRLRVLLTPVLADLYLHGSSLKEIIWRLQHGFSELKKAYFLRSHIPVELPAEIVFHSFETWKDVIFRQIWKYTSHVSFCDASSRWVGWRTLANEAKK